MSELSGSELHTALLQALGWEYDEHGFSSNPHDDVSDWHLTETLATGNGMLLILAEMQRRGWDVQMTSYKGGHCGWGVVVWNEQKDVVGLTSPYDVVTNLPTAVYRAGLAALESEQ